MCALARQVYAVAAPPVAITLLFRPAAQTPTTGSIAIV
jgi:hypothetical protein